jgi:hypothetical protein
MSEYSISPESGNTSTENAQFDAARIQRLMDDIKSKQSIGLAILGGLVAAIIAAIAWGFITYATGYKIGFVAIGVGFLVGFAVRFCGKGLTMPFGIVGALLALFGCVLGNFLTVVIVASKLDGFSAVLSYIAASPSVIFEVMTATFSPMDLVFYAIAVYEGYRFSFYELNEDEIASLRSSQAPPPLPSTPPEAGK